jgi:transcriptional regulator with XRE-family HTH domain
MIGIGERLRQLREAKGWSQGEAARRSGLLRPYICRVERGHTVPTLPILEKWAKALGVTLREFFNEEVVSRKPLKIVRVSSYGKRLLDLFRRIDRVDQQLLLSVANTMAERGGKRGRPK